MSKFHAPKWEFVSRVDSKERQFCSGSVSGKVKCLTSSALLTTRSAYRMPTWEIVSHVNSETWELWASATAACTKKERFVAPPGFYQFVRTSNAIWLFYEHWVAYIIGGQKVSNSGVNCPDVQLLPNDPNERLLLFEVKSGRRGSGILLKKNQCQLFYQYGNCYYAVVFHQSKNTQKRWDEWKTQKRAVKEELESPSSVFVVPAWFMWQLYMKHIGREQPMKHYKHLDERCIRISESGMRTAFSSQETDIPKIIDGSRWIHILSPELTLNAQSSNPLIIRV